MIVITARDLQARDRERLNSGVHSVLVKDMFRPDELVGRIRRLVRAAEAIKGVFGSRDQDIEWAYMRGQIYIVQSRPFIPGG